MLPQPLDDMTDIVAARPEPTRPGTILDEERDRLGDFSVDRTDFDAPFLITRAFDICHRLLSVGAPAADEVRGNLIEDAEGVPVRTRRRNKVGRRASIRPTPNVEDKIEFIYGLGQRRVFRCPVHPCGTVQPLLVAVRAVLKSRVNPLFGDIFLAA